LEQADYQSACIGKWHLGLEAGDHPVDRGFKFFHGFLGDMMDDYFDHLRHGNNYMRLGRKEINPAGHATTLFANWAIKAIDQMSAEENPYFLYLAFNAPHTPVQPPKSTLLQVQSRLPDVSPRRANLIALIEDMDSAIGRVLEKVEATGRDTLVIFVSDNGGQLSAGADNGDLRDGKQSNYEGGLRVPAIWCWPGRIPAGSTCQAIGVTMDVVPTLCELTNIEPPAEIDGMSLVPWLSAPETPQADREVYYVRREGGMRYAGLTIQALRQGDWKLVHNLPTQGFELFNLASDPQEKQNLADQQPARLRKLKDAMMLHIQRGGQVAWQPQH
jgi:arylsulfatase A-like enzyme